MKWPMIPLTVNAAIFDEFASAFLQFDVVNFCYHAAGGTHFFRLCVVAHGGDIDSVDISNVKKLLSGLLPFSGVKKLVESGAEAVFQQGR